MIVYIMEDVTEHLTTENLETTKSFIEMIVEIIQACGFCDKK